MSEESRRKLASFSLNEKVKLLEKLRQRSLALAGSAQKVEGENGPERLVRRRSLFQNARNLLAYFLRWADVQLYLPTAERIISLRTCHSCKGHFSRGFGSGGEL